MTAAVLTRSDDMLADGSEWAVETHGLTKRFGDNVAVNGVELWSRGAAHSAISVRTGPARPLL